MRSPYVKYEHMLLAQSGVHNKISAVMLSERKRTGPGLSDGSMVKDVIPFVSVMW